MSGNHQSKKQKEARQIFICTCRKQYQSFPALYLHNKTKHEITIHTRDKLKMKKKSVWSGNRKRVVYEFSSDAQLDEKTSSKQSENTKLRCSERFKNRIRPEQNESKEIKNIINQFIEFQAGKNEAPQLRKSARDLFFQLFKFLSLKNELQVLPEEEHKGNFKNKLQIFPYFLNPFVTECIGFPTSSTLPQRQRLKMLEQFSKWLYQKKVCKFMAILNVQNSTK